ncbi:MAG: glycosyltransferase family 2 protein [Bacteroidota bacterium]|nr:glycosyltransferase family 2 protein [Bacteroidota bacterium]
MTNDQLPLVTVITPAYNQGIFLRETIESVLSQDYPNIELFVINDGSTDETEAILREYTGRIRWETQKNMGQTPTINKGWQMTNGQIITWLNSDDTFLPGGVRTGVEYLLNHPDTSVVFGETLLTEADGTPLPPPKKDFGFDYNRFVATCTNTVCQPSSFYWRHVIEKVGELDPKFYYFMDWDLWLRAGLYFKIVHIPDLLSTYRLHAESKTVAQAIKAAPELEYMYNKYFSRTDLPEDILKLKNEAMMNMFFMSGGYYAKGGDAKLASKMASLAMQQYPRGILSYSNLHKYLYCKLGTSSAYKKLKSVFVKAPKQSAL